MSRMQERKKKVQVARLGSIQKKIAFYGQNGCKPSSLVEGHICAQPLWSQSVTVGGRKRGWVQSFALLSHSRFNKREACTICFFISFILIVDKLLFFVRCTILPWFLESQFYLFLALSTPLELSRVLAGRKKKQFSGSGRRKTSPCTTLMGTWSLLFHKP